MLGKALWQNLKVLVDFDRQLSSLNNEIETAKMAIADFTVQISKIGHALEIKKNAAFQTRKQIDAFELKVKVLDEHEKQKRDVLSKIKTQQEYKSLEHEIDYVRREKMKLENEITEYWYRLENMQSDIAVDESSFAQKIDNLTKDIQIREESIKDCSQKMEMLLDQRQKSAITIPAEWLVRYERMKHNVEDPIVAVVNDCCGACYYAILRQDVSKIKQAGVLPCRNCYRFLYYNDEEQKDLQQAKF